jgi:hypothetical protein
MAAAQVIGSVISPVILAVIYYALMTPIGLAGRLFGMQFMRATINKQLPTYWQAVAETDKRYDRQF